MDLDITSLKYICAVFFAVVCGLSLTGCDSADKPISSELYAFQINKPMKGNTRGALCKLITAEARKRKINPIIPLAIAEVESSYRIHSKSPVGAIGVMQIMPANAARCKSTPLNLIGGATNIKCGVQIINEELKFYSDDLELALRSYNGGPKCVKNRCAESEAYAKKVSRLIARKHTDLLC